MTPKHIQRPPAHSFRLGTFMTTRQPWGEGLGATSVFATTVFYMTSSKTQLDNTRMLNIVREVRGSRGLLLEATFPDCRAVRVQRDANMG